MNQYAIPSGRDDAVGRLSRGDAVSPMTINLHVVIFRVICFLLVVFVFEETLYGRLPLSAAQYVAAKTASEALLYLLLLTLVTHRIYQANILEYEITRVDVLIGTFLLCALIATIAVRGASVVLGLVDLRTMLRYMAIFYIIVLARWIPSERQFWVFARLIVGLAVIQTIIVVVQHLAGDSFRDDYFGPQIQHVEVAGFQAILGRIESKLGGGYGTFGKTSLLASYLFFGTVVAVSVALSGFSKRRMRWWTGYFVMLIGIYLSYKRGPLILALAVPPIIAALLGRGRRLAGYLLLGAFLVPLALVTLMTIRPDTYVSAKQVELSPAESMAQLLSVDYWRNTTLKARGWVIMNVGREALTSLKPLGYGADEEAAKREMARKGGEFGKLVNWGPMDDVYVVAGLVYYGPIGVLLLFALFTTLYRWSRGLTHAPLRHVRLISVMLAAALILMFPYAFLAPILEFRAFAFLLWVMAGVVVSSSLMQRRHSLSGPTKRPVSLAHQG